MKGEYSTHNKMENKSQYPSTLPKNPTLDFLKGITDNFSNEREIGRGAFGVVYKGVLANGEVIAVKKLEITSGIHARRFQNEADNLLELEHQNIVKLIGSCFQAGRQVVKLDGKYVFTDVVEKLLCYEYLFNRSLDSYIYDESNAIDWPTRFKIIMGICNGLHFLHKERNEAIIHMNLKPSNILLGENMVPKIADFGLSRLFGQEQTRLITQTVVGWIGYIAPEYYSRGEISEKSDIFSLGVLILETVTGFKNDTSSQEVSSRIFIDNFQNEAGNLTSLNHTNIVKLYGYCYEIRKEVVENDRKFIFRETPKRLLCYEYLPRGSLDKYIYGESSEINWDVRFKIIEGICQGLKFLHDLKRPIIHLDLKPENVLLDDNMMPKIADFGLSRLLGEQQTRTCTLTVAGSKGYIAPEYYYNGEISTKSDIFSLGVLIIEIIRKNWTKMPQIASNYPLLEANSLQQVKRGGAFGGGRGTGGNVYDAKSRMEDKSNRLDTLTISMVARSAAAMGSGVGRRGEERGCGGDGGKNTGEVGEVEKGDRYVAGV
uniref:non-specific serine/threonine protein kinase n=1 Tax=Leersia perrieri TaxID=77586 RepID=A0A0D9XQH4_9ORYZ